jgi:hypothetical protein
MPRFDGTGPRGAGPMSGRGEGHCVLQFSEPGQLARGYAGQDGAPVGPEPQARLGSMTGAPRGWRNPFGLRPANGGRDRLPDASPATLGYAYGFWRRCWCLGAGFRGRGPRRSRGCGRGRSWWW